MPAHLRDEALKAGAGQVDYIFKKQAVKQQQMENKLKKNRLPVDAIMDCIREGTTSKTELIATAAKNSSISKTKVTQALMEHTGLGELSATDTEHQNLFYCLCQRCLTKDGVYEDVRQKLAEREWVA